MSAPPLIHIEAPKRVPFDNTIPREGTDYSTATALMEIRAEAGDQGAPLVSLGMSTSGGEGIVLTFDSAYPDPDGGEPFPATILRIIINETTLEGLAYGSDPSESVTLAYDIHVSPSGGGKKFIWAAGRFIITPGVTL